MDERYIETEDYHAMMKQDIKLNKSKNLQLSNYEMGDHSAEKMLFVKKPNKVEDIIQTGLDRNWLPAKARYVMKIGTPISKGMHSPIMNQLIANCR